MDDDNSKSLDMNEFKKAVHDFRIEIPDDYIQTIFNAFDINKDGTIDYDEFVRIIRGDLTPPRMALVKKAYIKLDKDGSGIVDIEDIKDVYNTSKHPDVISGKKSRDQVLVEFLETFEMHHNVMHGTQADGMITLEEFIEYYTNISASLDNDEYFALMMNNSWNLSGDANPYKKQEKGWSNASPEKKNQFAGEPHKGYNKGADSNKMVVQRSGMMSGENPLSTTTRYYNNPYDSKRQTPSVANNNRNYGEPERGYYQRTGEESKNNPFYAQEATYQTHHGKKVEEKVSRPENPKPKHLTYTLNRIKEKCV